MRIESKKVPDGEGGWTTGWTDGVEFMAAIVLDTSTQAVIAEREGVAKIYRVTTPKMDKIIEYSRNYYRD